MVVKGLVAVGAPWALILSCLLLGWTTNIHHDGIGFSNFFAGMEAEANALREHSLSGHTHDLMKGGMLYL